MNTEREYFLALVEKLSIPGEYGLDCETTGIRWEDRLFSVIFHTGSESFYFDFDLPMVGYRGTFRRDFIPLLQSIFMGQSKFYVSNAKFDMRMLRHEGLSLGGEFFCTNAQGRVLKNNYISDREYSLAASSSRLGYEKDESVEEYIVQHKLYTVEKIPGKEKLWKNKRFWEVPKGIVRKYAEQDANLHRIVGKHIESELASVKNLSSTVGDIRHISANEMKLTKVCHEMEWQGIRISRGYVRNAMEFETQEVENGRKQFKELSGGRDFIDSNKVLNEVFRECGYENIPQTLKGNPSFTDENLELLGGPIAEAVRKIRSHEKRLSTYYSSFLYYAGKDDIIHCNLRQSGAETGRFSCSDPNLQNVPQEEKVNHEQTPSIVRASFIPKPGFNFVSLDYSQQEFRILLDYAGELELISKINEGHDVHQATADMVGIGRTQAKTLNFAIIYGAGPAKISGMLGCSVAEATELRNRYFCKLPKVKKFLNDVITRGKLRGYIVNWAGRHCYLANPDWAFILPNHLVQSGGADVIKFAMPKIHDFLLDSRSRMILTVHDEILLEMSPDEMHLVPKIREIMESVYRSFNGMKLTTSASISKRSWAKCDMEKLDGSKN
jgi:DNA polymerase-1